MPFFVGDILRSILHIVIYFVARCRDIKLLVGIKRINLLNKVDVVSSLLSGISPLIFEVTFFMKFIFFSLRNVIMSNENFQVSNLVLFLKLIGKIADFEFLYNNKV